MGELKVTVSRVDDVADGVRVLELRHPDGDPLPAWTPGAHVDLELPVGGADGDLVRQYSLCGDPDDAACWRVAVLREQEGRGGSAHVHDVVALGDVLAADGPRNHFALEPSPRYVFVAGGIGITPLLPMLAAAEAAGAEWRLEYGGRSRASMAFVDDLVQRYGKRVHVRPQDETGLLPLAELLAPQPDTLVYCCGPEPLLAAVEDVVAGWPGERADGTEVLHLERFTGAVVDTGGDVAFEVELAETGGTLTVPADRSVLSVLEEAGVPILSSCTEGTCGTCETGVLAGEVEHRDVLLTDAERAANDVMFVCVSRAAAGCPKLTLEL